MRKTLKQQIEDFKRSNKERRLKTAIKAGFTTAEEFLANLEKRAKKSNRVKVKKGLFYVIDILDASASMAGGKYNNSKEGIIAGIKDLTARKDVKYSLVEFIDAHYPLNKPIVNQIPAGIDVTRIGFRGAIGGNTPLYFTVYDVISNLQVNKEDKVLLKVYTDGGNNTLYEYTQKAAELISKVQKENFTVTFVATPEDLSRIMRDINIDKSNTLATANTAEGFKMSMTKSRAATVSYFASADVGQNVLTGFYKEEGTL